MKKEELNKKIDEQEVSWNCRFHPTDGWHEIGCPDQEWGKEDLLSALIEKKKFEQSAGQLLDADQFSNFAQKLKMLLWEKILYSAKKKKELTEKSLDDVALCLWWHFVDDKVKAIKEERQAWLNHERCFTCGEPKEPATLTDTCGECLENG